MANPIFSDNTVPSSPSAAVFSDELQRTASPPSSPPGFPWEQPRSSPNVTKPLQSPKKTAFSVLGKRKALGSIGDNARPRKKALSQPMKPAQPLTQMQICLGQEVQKKCKTCGMEYVQSSGEDRKLHDRYHKQNAEGYDVGKDFVQKARPNSVFEGVKKGDKICQLVFGDKLARKKRGQAALEVVQRELGAVEIPEEAIWDLHRGIQSNYLDPEYHAYLYIRGTKCVGFLLTQRIKEAYTVVEPANYAIESEALHTMGQESGGSARDALKARHEADAKRLEALSQRPIELSNDLRPAVLGISRIWTSATHRKQKIAVRLLDVAYMAHNLRVAELNRIDAEIRAQPDMQNGNYEQLREQIDHLRIPEPKLESLDDVAFSQPTEAGTRLARKWFGKIFGWKVYVD